MREAKKFTFLGLANGLECFWESDILISSQSYPHILAFICLLDAPFVADKPHGICGLHSVV